MSASPAKDVFEEVDDPSELLSKPLEHFPVMQPQSPQRERQLPSAATPLASSPKANGTQQQQGSGSRTWQPPPAAKAAALPAHNPLIIGGSGARVPTQFLDSSGGYAKPAQPAPHQNGAQASGSAQTIQQSLPGSLPDVKPVKMPAQASRFKSASSRYRDAIDLTGSDDEDVKPTPKSEFASNGKTAIKIDDDDDDEPVMVSHKRPSPGVEVDHEKTNAVVCAGLINAVVLCMYGLPPSLAYTGTMDQGPPFDPVYSKPNWSSSTHFWANHKYRPVSLSLSNPPNVPAPQRQLPGGWTYMAPTPVRTDINVSAILAPLAAHPHLPPQQAIAKGHVYTAPFGNLAEKYSTALEPLLVQNKVRFEARCQMLPASRAGNFLHSVELLVFARRADLGLVSERLASHGIQLDHPGDYHKEDYPTEPEYSNPHNPPPGGFRNDPALTMYSGIYRGTGLGTSVQDKALSEQEKKEQVDMIYASIKSGEDLAGVEPVPIVTTKLMPHQKQALGFLLNREKDRRWAELLKVKQKKPASSEAVATKHDPSDVSAKKEEVNGSLTNGTEKEEKSEDEEDSISLWKVRKGLDGKIRGWRNMITNRETLQQPRICRGSILADDMGLGKTITTIALIAHNLSEARAFSLEEVQRDLNVERAQQIEPTATKRDPAQEEADESDEDSEPDASAYATTVYNNLFGGPAGATKKSKKKKVDPEIMRRKHIEHRSRATLIVCPLSVVSNWEDQFKEHWDRRKQPSIYLYHGSARITDPKRLANYDIVITTYQTLGYEFANQTTWVTDDSGKSDKRSKQQQEEEAEEEDEFLMVDGNGDPLRADKKGKKRKRKAKEAPNTLQRVEWFRVVLDEAHYIKGAGTWQSKAVCNLSAQRRLCLTGTPIQNTIDDLFALLRFLRLDPFTDRATWNEFCGHREATGLSAKTKENDPIDSANVGHVQIVMKFLALRRQKTSKTADGKDLLTLPPKMSKTEYLEFGEMEKARYQTLHHQYKEEFEEMMAQGTVSTNYATILHEILNLRLTCDHPSLVDASKDAKRKEQGADLFSAIEQDGLSRERAALLFILFRDSEMAYCSECQLDLSASGEMDAGREADALTDALNEAADDRNGRGKKKARNSNASTPLNTSRNGMDTPLDPDADSANVQPVITRCQHLFCSPCFGRLIGCSWPSTSAADYAHCPACSKSLQLVIDAVQLHPSDFVDLNEEQADNMSDDDSDGRGRGRARVKDDDDFDWGSDKEYTPAPSTRTRSTRNGKAAVKGEDVEEKEENPAPTGGGEGMLEGRKDLSTKIKALVTDLIPFSQCNPHSALFDPMAPQLQHVDTSQSDDPEVKASGEPVVVIQRPPPAANSFLMKLDFAMDSLDSYNPIKSVVFSQWTKMLDRIQKSLKITGIRYTRLDGTMKRADRSAALERFRTDPGTEILLVSLRAGGTGLNLVSACRAYLMDPYWNPAVENQGLDRIHRMGQQQPVITTKYVMKHSIEENMLRLQKRKMMLAETVGSRRQLGGATNAEKRKEERREELKILFGTSNGGVEDVA